MELLCNVMAKRLLNFFFFCKSRIINIRIFRIRSVKIKIRVYFLFFFVSENIRIFTKVYFYHYNIVIYKCHRMENQTNI